MNIYPLNDHTYMHMDSFSRELEMEKNNPPPYVDLNNQQEQHCMDMIGYDRQPQYPSQQQPSAPAIIIQPTANIQHHVTSNFGPKEQKTYCPYCHYQALTEVKSVATTRTHCAACLLCVFLCWPCLCLPYCMKSCRNQNHYCRQCKTFLGSYEH